MNAVTQEIPVAIEDVPRLEERALVLANQISTLLDHKSTRFTSPLVMAIAKIPVASLGDTPRTRARRAEAIRAVKAKYASVKQTAVPLWERLNEPRLDEIRSIMRDLAVLIDAIEP